MEKFFNDIKNEFLRIIGKNDSVQKAENGAELLTALQSLPSVSEQIANETGKIKGNIEQEFNSKINSLNESTGKEINLLKEAISKMTLEINKATPTMQAANATIVPSQQTEDINAQIKDLSKKIVEVALGVKK